MSGRRVSIAAGIAALALAAAGCGGSSKSSSANDHGARDVAGKSEIRVELDDFYFDPTVLKGTPGQKLRIELENEGTVEHNLSIDAQKIDRDVEAGENAKVTVTFPSSGTVSFYCSYHRARGMAGDLQVGSGGGAGSGTTTNSSKYGY